VGNGFNIMKTNRGDDDDAILSVRVAGAVQSPVTGQHEVFVVAGFRGRHHRRQTGVLLLPVTTTTTTTTSSGTMRRRHEMKPVT